MHCINKDDDQKDQPSLFHPKILSTFKEYTLKHLLNDLTSGMIVGIVALPLAIAFGIASGVTPEQGIITAVIAGFLISLLGGSRVQIGGPTGAFVILISVIVQRHGVTGLMIATLLAGIILIAMGMLRLGNWIQYIPPSVVTGFTSGIAFVIFSIQIKDFLGIHGSVPGEMVERFSFYWRHLANYSHWAIIISLLTIGIIVFGTRFFPRIPSTFIALGVISSLVYFYQIPVDTIGSRFGSVSGDLHFKWLPSISLSMLRELILPAISIALLGAIESLLSAVVSDGMIGGKHRPNTELIAQGIANIITPFFGGIPATGAIARTATNIKMGGRTPVAGIIHALTLFAILYFFAPLAAEIPMPVLAGILIVVAYNMSEWREFKRLMKAPKSDVGVLVLTFSLTVLFDLSLAIQAGVVLSSIVFVGRMADVSGVTKKVENTDNDFDTYYDREGSLAHLQIPENIQILEVQGAFFFGAIGKFETILLEQVEQHKIILLRMNRLTYIDGSGLMIMKKMLHEIKQKNGVLKLVEVDPCIYGQLKKYGILNVVGEQNIYQDIEQAVEQSITQHPILESSVLQGV